VGGPGGRRQAITMKKFSCWAGTPNQGWLLSLCLSACLPLPRRPDRRPLAAKHNFIMSTVNLVICAAQAGGSDPGLQPVGTKNLPARIARAGGGQSECAFLEHHVCGLLTILDATFQAKCPNHGRLANGGGRCRCRPRELTTGSLAGRQAKWGDHFLLVRSPLLRRCKETAATPSLDDR